MIPVIKINLSGGKNPPLSPTEAEFKLSMGKIFREQYNYAVKNEIWNKNDYEWIKKKEWNIKFETASRKPITKEFVKGAKQGSKKLGISVLDYLDRPNIIKAIRTQEIVLADTVGTSSISKVRKTIEEGLKNGDSQQMMSQRMAKAFGIDEEDDWNNYRAERIARTETSRAMHKGEITLWEETGVVEGKEWLVSADACPFCLAMRGKIVGLKDNFWRKGDTMLVNLNGDNYALDFNVYNIDAPPLHPNCRCDTLAVLVDSKPKTSRR